jgi:hypothetical protein
MDQHLTHRTTLLLRSYFLLAGILIIAAGCRVDTHEADRIKPWSENHAYWQYKGEPLLLLGGSDQDNLFNHPNIGPDGLEAHLDLLVSAGGNYLRNTMSSRDRIDPESDLYNDINLYPFHRDEETGLYDLNQWNEAFWDQFHDYLMMTEQRGIIIQIEIFDRWDYGPDRYPEYMAYGWSAHPFNPKNNLNYAIEETNMDLELWQNYPVFRTIPELDNVPVVLKYQEALVDRILSATFDFGHILYCISNESTSSEEWSRYWAGFIQEKALEAGVGVEITEMWNHWDLSNPMHQRTIGHSGIYSYIDISQNNHQNGQAHWDNMMAARQLISDQIRPMNNVKIYGGDRHGGGLIEGVNKFWRNIMGGCASARFHRPGRIHGYYGAGLSELAQTQIRSARMFEEAFDIFRAQPDADSYRLTVRDDNEAYLTYIPGEQYAVYFPDGGTVSLDLNDVQGRINLKWLDISQSIWLEEDAVDGGGQVQISTPKEGQWLAVITKM